MSQSDLEMEMFWETTLFIISISVSFNGKELTLPGRIFNVGFNIRRNPFVRFVFRKPKIYNKSDSFCAKALTEASLKRKPAGCLLKLILPDDILVQVIAGKNFLSRLKL